MNIKHNDWVNSLPKTPESIKTMIKDTVEEQMYRKTKRNNGVWKAATLLLACIICAGGTVAATSIWQMNSKKEHNFALKTIIEGTSIDGQENEESKLYTYELAYIPEYLSFDYANGLEYKDNSKAGASFWFINANKITELVDTHVVDYENTTVGEYPTTIVYRSLAEEEVTRTLYYVLFESEEMLLEICNMGIPHEDMITIIEGLSMKETTDTSAYNLVVETSFVFEQKTADNVYNPPTYTSDINHDFTIYSCLREDMKNLHQMGEQFMVTGLLDAKVTDVKISNSKDILHPDGRYLTTYPAAQDFDEEGKLLGSVKQTLAYGDGIDSLNEVVDEETYSTTLVYVEVEYSNSSDWELESKDVHCRLLAAQEKEDTFVLKNGGTGYRPMDFYNGTKYNLEKNYTIPALGVGESCTVYWAFKVPTSDLPYLFVGLNNIMDNFDVDGLDPETLEIGLVDIRQR